MNCSVGQTDAPPASHTSCILTLAALLHGCRKRALLACAALTYILHFSCKFVSFQSGAEGIRTPDLRRAKAARRFRGCSLLFEDPLASAALHPIFTVNARRCSRALSANCRQLSWSMHPNG